MRWGSGCGCKEGGGEEGGRGEKVWGVGYGRGEKGEKGSKRVKGRCLGVGRGGGHRLGGLSVPSFSFFSPIIFPFHLFLFSCFLSPFLSSSFITNPLQYRGLSQRLPPLRLVLSYIYTPSYMLYLSIWGGGGRAPSVRPF